MERKLQPFQFVFCNLECSSASTKDARVGLNSSQRQRMQPVGCERWTTSWRFLFGLIGTFNSILWYQCTSNSGEQ
eukprot:scaffold5707_cov112-Cylindrotheca_fusiformis.AAC.3